MNLEGKNYTLKCESQKKATKCLVKEGGSRWGQGVSHHSMSGHQKNNFAGMVTYRVTVLG